MTGNLRGFFIAVVAAAICALTVSWQIGSAAPVVTYVVNATTDTHDASPGSGGCVDASGKCSLYHTVLGSKAISGTCWANWRQFSDDPSMALPVIILDNSLNAIG